MEDSGICYVKSSRVIVQWMQGHTLPYTLEYNNNEFTWKLIGIFQCSHLEVDKRIKICWSHLWEVFLSTFYVMLLKMCKIHSHFYDPLKLLYSQQVPFGAIFYIGENSILTTILRLSALVKWIRLLELNPLFLLPDTFTQNAKYFVQGEKFAPLRSRIIFG